MLSTSAIRTTNRGTETRHSGIDQTGLAKTKLLAVQRNAEQGANNGNSPVRVNDPNLDYEASRFTGFTQSETSSAWCGDTVVVGFNDSSAFAHTVLLHQAEAISLSGVAVSHDGGASFVGFPFLNPGPAINPGSPFFDSELAGDPVVVCSDPSNFTYASIQIQIPVDSNGNTLAAFTGMAVNHSSDGGVTWQDPVTVIQKDLNSHFLDKEWLAVDPNNPGRMYMSYTDFQVHGTESDCMISGVIGIDAGPDASIELVSSTDGGHTWSVPVRLARQCSLDFFQNLSGTQVAIGSQGQVYVAYSQIDGKDVHVKLRRSDDGGISFGPETEVAHANSVSSLGFDNLQGNFRTNAFPSLAVDNSKSSSRGTVYLVWTSATRPPIPDILSTFFGIDDGFSFGDIVFSASADGGTTWTAPKVVSPTPSSFKGAGRDQFMAGIAVDGRGTVAVCYSDRRNDPNNFLIDHFCSVSNDQGGHFKDIRQTPVNWTPSEFTDGILNDAYMGDYDAVSSDATGMRTGFFSTFQVQNNLNPDVFGTRIQP